jgi:hypothetical protein
MKKSLTNGSQLLLFFTSLITSSAVAIAPSDAATLASSNTSLVLNNFNRPLENDVKAIFDGKPKLISTKGTGKIEARLDVDSFFQSVNSDVLANSNVQSNLVGTGSQYLGDIDFSAQLIGKFFVEAEQTFSFDFTAALSLNNSIDRDRDEAVSTGGLLSFLIFDNTRQQAIDSFSLSSQLSTDLTEKVDLDSVNFQPGNNSIFNNVFQDSSVGGAQEFYQAFIQGSFQKTFAEDTALSVVVVTENQSCAESSTTLNTCVKVSEPSNKFALTLGLGGIFFLGFARGIMKQII